MRIKKLFIPAAIAAAVLIGQNGYCDIEFNEHTIKSNYDGARYVTAADVDQDGDIDVLGTAYRADDVVWWENDGSQNFTKHTINSSFNGATCVYAIDFDGDGDIDILSNARNAKDIAWWENDGTESFTKHNIETNLNKAAWCYPVDLDGDDDYDVLAAADSDDDVVWYENDGDESFSKHTIDNNLNEVVCVFGIDIDDDNDIDILAAAKTADDIVWYENNGSESFTEHTIDGSYNGARDCFAIDLDEDGDIDVLAAAENADDITWWENDGSESFTEHTIDGSFDGAYSVYAEDVDGDGDYDVLGAAKNDDEITWWENDGSENFTERVVDDSFNGSHYVFAADIDSDGNMDILGAAYDDDDITWWENLSESIETVELAIPRDEYVMIGIPVYVFDGDAIELFGDDFDYATPGFPNWRVSQWDNVNQKYVRYQEEDFPPVAGDQEPEPFTPGWGYWVVQNVVDDCIIDIETGQISGLVAQSEDFTVELNPPFDDIRGLTQLANPYQVAYDWRTAVIITGEDEEMSIYEAADEDIINGYAYIWRYDVQEYAPVSFYGYDSYNLGAWEAFWIEQLDEDAELTLKFTGTDLSDANHNVNQGLKDDMWEEFELMVGVSTTGGEYRDDHNVIGSDSLSADGYDKFDAIEFNPYNNKFVQLYFPHAEWGLTTPNFTYDIRSIDWSEVKEWDFTIRIYNLDDSIFTISWPEIEDVYAGFTLSFEDIDSSVVIDDMRATSSYTFSNDSSSLTYRHFRINVSWELLSVNKPENILPNDIILHKAYPNPFNSTTIISYELPTAGKVLLKVYNIEGRQVAVLEDGMRPAGTNTVRFEAGDFASGIYFVRLETSGKSIAQKMILLK